MLTNDLCFQERLREGLSDSMCDNYEQEIQQLREENKKLGRQLSELAREKVENEEQCMRHLSDETQISAHCAFHITGNGNIVIQDSTLVIVKKITKIENPEQ